MIYEIGICVDTNDMDYKHNIKKISEEELNRWRPLFAAIKAFEPYKGEWSPGKFKTFSHNWPTGECCRQDMGEKGVKDIYPEFDEDFLMEFEDEWLPSGLEYGFHDIVRIEVYPMPEKERLV